MRRDLRLSRVARVPGSEFADEDVDHARWVPGDRCPASDTWLYVSRHGQTRTPKGSGLTERPADPSFSVMGPLFTYRKTTSIGLDFSYLAHDRNLPLIVAGRANQSRTIPVIHSVNVIIRRQGIDDDGDSRLRIPGNLSRETRRFSFARRCTERFVITCLLISFERMPLKK